MPVVKAPSPGAAGAVEHPLVIRGGRVVDPARSLDASADVAIEDARIVAVGPGLRGRVVLDATGCVVAPGFIDLHSHA
jgi:dihydroorotase